MGPSSSMNSADIVYDTDDIPTLLYRQKEVSQSSPTTFNECNNSYENNTYIDWSKESLSASKATSYLTKKWVSIIISALLAGYATTIIDLTSAWLNDLKKGLCFSRIERWSLLNPYMTCPADDWYSWSRLLFNTENFASSMFVNFPIYLIFASVWVGVAAYITITKSLLTKQSGIAEIKLIISGLNYKVDEYLSTRILLFKILGLILVVSSGLWLGKEGPLVHVTCCIENILFNLILGKEYPNEAVRRELLSAATATGISVAFNSPIGGVLFVLESLHSYFVPTKIMWNSFISATVATVVLMGFRVFTEGQNFYEQELFKVTFGNFSWLFLEIVPFVLLGVFGGIYGYSFIRLNSKFSSQVFRYSVHSKLCKIFNLNHTWGSYLEVFCILVFTTLLNFPLELTKLPLSAYLQVLFTACPTDTSSSSSSAIINMCSQTDGVLILKLLYISIQGFILSTYTFGIDLPGGILMPSLVLGATFGRLLGILCQAIQRSINWDSLATCTETSCLVSPSSYAVVGAASFMSGITKLTMTVVVIIFELTGAVTYVLPIMIAVMVSKYINDWLCNENIYDTWIKLNFNKNFHSNELNQGKGSGLVQITNYVKNKLPNSPAASVMVPIEKMKCICLIPETPYTIKSIFELINDDSHEGYPLILSYKNPVSIGYVTKQHLSAKVAVFDILDSEVSFQIDHLPKEVLSRQLHYEQSLNFSSLIKIDLTIEKSIFMVNDMMPLILILELFEKLYLNYVIIRSHKSRNDELMVGFIDRFILSKLIESDLSSLEFESNLDQQMNEFNIGNTYEENDLVDMREERFSIELIT